MQENFTDPYVVALFDNFGLEDYPVKRTQIRKIFQSYRGRTDSDPVRLWAELMIKNHAKFCQRYGDALSIRRHNSFVLKYVGGHSDRTIAQRQSVVPRTVEHDVEAVLNDLLIMVYGIDGLRPKPDKVDSSDTLSRVWSV